MGVHRQVRAAVAAADRRFRSDGDGAPGPSREGGVPGRRMAGAGPPTRTVAPSPGGSGGSGPAPELPGRAAAHAYSDRDPCLDTDADAPYAGNEMTSFAS